MRSFKKYSDRGFTLIELMIVVAIVGVLSALAIYGVTKYLRSSKTAEVKTALGQMGKDAVSAYNREQMSGDILPGGSSATVANTLCFSATATVPASKTDIAGKKYQSKTGLTEDWNKDKATAWTGFSCLKFGINEPQYFMYEYKSGSTDFTAAGYGDLNGDGTTSSFVLAGAVENGVVKLSPNFKETDPEE